MKYVGDSLYADPEKAASRLMEIAHTIVPAQDDRIHIEKINYPFLVNDKETPARIRSRAQAGDRARLAMDARKRHLREDYAGRRQPVRLD